MPTSNVKRQPQPWHADATQNHGGTIGFLCAMVHFFRFQLGKSLTDITVCLSQAAFKEKLSLHYFFPELVKSMFFSLPAKLSD